MDIDQPMTSKISSDFYLWQILKFKLIHEKMTNINSKEIIIIQIIFNELIKLSIILI